MMSSSRLLSIVVKILTVLSLPTLAAAQQAPEVGCSICGDGLRVREPDELFVFPGQPTIPCGEYEQDGFNGKIPISTCLFLPALIAVCDCGEPRAPSASAAPTISLAPSDTPTSTTAPSTTPSIRPSNVPTITSSPTDESLFNPDVGCSICGDGLRVREPDELFAFPGQPTIPCGELEQDGFNGKIRLEECYFLPALIEVCDCGEPRAPSASAAPTISLAPSDTPTATTAPSATPSIRPSNFPTITSSPTDESFVFHVDACFSKHNKVLSKDKGLVPISELTIGDYILAAGNDYELVYSLAHYAPTKKANFIRVATTAQTDDAGPLELSSNHMVFTGVGKAVMAKSLQIGDSVLLPNGDNAEIASIEWVWSEGLFAPFTTSGTLVVNGIVASSYVDVTHVPWVCGHWLANVFQIPHRIICTWYLDWCKHETYSDEGLSRWVSAPAYFLRWGSKQHVVFRGAFHAIAVTLICLWGIVTEIYGYYCGCPLGGLTCCCSLVICIGAFVVLLNAGRGRWVVNLTASFGSSKRKVM